MKTRNLIISSLGLSVLLFSGVTFAGGYETSAYQGMWERAGTASQETPIASSGRTFSGNPGGTLKAVATYEGPGTSTAVQTRSSVVTNRKTQVRRGGIRYYSQPRVVQYVSPLSDRSTRQTGQTTNTRTSSTVKSALNDYQQYLIELRNSNLNSGSNTAVINASDVSANSNTVNRVEQQNTGLTSFQQYLLELDGGSSNVTNTTKTSVKVEGAGGTEVPSATDFHATRNSLRRTMTAADYNQWFSELLETGNYQDRDVSYYENNYLRELSRQAAAKERALKLRRTYGYYGY